MRMLHNQEEPNVAYDLFTDPELKGFFHQTMSVTTLMDCLMKNEQYEKVINVCQIMKKKHDGKFIPSDYVMLTSAACLKLNTAESLAYCMDVLEHSHRFETIMPMRAYV